MTAIKRTIERAHPLDLSKAALRAVSPVHILYLKNMDVSASMSISLIVDGVLWGLIACHHTRPKRPDAQHRQQLEFFGAMLSTILESLLRTEAVNYHRGAREQHIRLMSQISATDGSVDDLLPELVRIQDQLAACGTATYVDGRLRLSG